MTAGSGRPFVGNGTSKGAAMKLWRYLHGKDEGGRVWFMEIYQARTVKFYRYFGPCCYCDDIIPARDICDAWDHPSRYYGSGV